MTMARVVAAALLAASAAGGSAHGTTTDPEAAMYAVVLPDGPGDVWTYSDTTAGYEPGQQPAADVLDARVTHARHAVRVRMEFDDLRKVNTQRYHLDIRTPNGAIARFIVEAKGGQWRGKAWQEIEGEWVHVAGLRHHIDYASDAVKLRVARSLLDQPAWVRVRPRNELGLKDGSTFFTDNPTTDSPRPRFTRRLVWLGGEPD